MGVCSLNASADVIMTANVLAPATNAIDQVNLLDDATIPGGTFNQQAFSDNGGPPGQTFTTPAGSLLTLDAFSFKGANTGATNTGGNVFTQPWGVRVSSVNGTQLTPLLTFTTVAPPSGAIAGNEWFTWTFSGPEKLTLQPSTTYAFEVYSSVGYQGFDAAVSPDSYPGGVAFNSTSPIRSFSSTTIQDRGYDRTFVADLSVIPEPASAVMLLSGIALLARRRRR